jgi:hypothetical protein
MAERSEGAQLAVQCLWPTLVEGSEKECRLALGMRCEISVQYSTVLSIDRRMLLGVPDQVSSDA